jgi:hypothetical protein
MKTSVELKNLEKAIQFTEGRLTTLLGEASDMVFDGGTDGSEVMIQKNVDIGLYVDDLREVIFGTKIDIHETLMPEDTSELSLRKLEQEVWNTMEKLDELVEEASSIVTEEGSVIQELVTDKLVNIWSEVEESADLLFPTWMSRR